MIYISHRGNIDGPNPSEENKPEYIEHALEQRYRVEVDAWTFGDGTTENVFLGHDEPEYRVNLNWMMKYSDQLVVHCKNAQALILMSGTFNTFWHQTDDYTLTSKGWIWTYPNKPAPKPSAAGMSITVALGKGYPWKTEGFRGICSDYIASYRND